MFLLRQSMIFIWQLSIAVIGLSRAFFSEKPVPTLRCRGGWGAWGKAEGNGKNVLSTQVSSFSKRAIQQNWVFRKVVASRVHKPCRWGSSHPWCQAVWGKYRNDCARHNCSLQLLLLSCTGTCSAGCSLVLMVSAQVIHGGMKMQRK